MVNTKLNKDFNSELSARGDDIPLVIKDQDKVYMYPRFSSPLVFTTLNLECISTYSFGDHL